MTYQKDIQRIWEIAAKASADCGSLMAFSSQHGDNPQKLAWALGCVMAGLESSVLEARNLAERCWPRYEEARPGAPKWRVNEIAGTVELTEYGWLHIELNALLPHCRYHAPAYLSDTITRLVEGFRHKGKGRIRCYKKALMVIEEHCSIKNRQVFDPDNKGWKAVVNALKGVAFEDDDQFSLELALLSALSSKPRCHIYVMDYRDADTFFIQRAESRLFF